MNEKVIPVKVALRIRPLVPREEADACAECIRSIENAQQVILGKDKAFTYDYVFNKQSPQIEVYEEAVQPLLGSLFKGYNTTVLAYGQTGSGKTHTMGSSSLQIYDCDNAGVIPRVLNDIFYRIDETKDVKFTVRVSFVEIYNEDIKDLLNPKQAEPLNIREENNTIKVVNLTETVVTSAAYTKELLERGSSVRVVGGTAMNEQSSRSHAIFTITLEQLNENENHLIKSKFHLVDLAGSERQSKTKAEGLRLKEGININLGLLALGNVISVLGEDHSINKIKHVPYRESKLTRLLQDSLGGNSHTVMIACVSPADSNMEETLNTLRYADRARKIKNKPVVNLDPQAAELISLRQQVQDLKLQLYQITGGTLPTGCETDDFNTIKDENQKLKMENMKLASELQRLIHINRMTYERLTKIEVEKDDLEKKLGELKQLFKKAKTETVNTSVSHDGTLLDLAGVTPNSTLFNDIENKIDELDQLKVKHESNSEQQDNNDLNDENAPIDKDYALRQAKMQIQLNEYDSELFKKQMLHQKMLESSTQYGLITYKYENCTSELKHKVELLEREKEELQESLKQGDAAKKVSEQRRERLKELENEVQDLRRKERDFQRQVKVREENEKQCEKLRQEIVNIKTERVKLIKQMKVDTEQFRKYKQEKEKEVNQLKALERKRLVEISKLQEGNNRQEAVLRRKNEEISRIQKQLRETFEKQKQVAEKRQMAFDRKDTSSTAEKLRQWIIQEIEVSVSLAEGRLTLSKLIDERKELAVELARLQSKHKSLDPHCQEEPPPSKVMKREISYDLDTTYVANSSGPCDGTEANEDSVAYLRERIQHIKNEIECKNTQINEIQQMVIEGDQDDRIKHMFNNLHGMLEAKILLKHLYNCSVQYLLDLKQKQINYEYTSNSLNNEIKEVKRKYEIIEDDLNRANKLHATEIDNISQNYEQRILYLLKTNVADLVSYTTDEKFNILAQQIDMVERKMNKEDHPDNYRKEASNREESKRNNKLKREMRRTRVIRIYNKPELQNSYDAISENSPFASPMVCTDDKEKDPDWVNTPLRIKPTNLTKKQKRMSRTSKSSSTLRASQKENLTLS